MEMNFFKRLARCARRARLWHNSNSAPRCGREAEQLGDLVFIEPHEEPQLHDFRLFGRGHSEFIQSRIDLQETFIVRRRCNLDLVQIDTRQLGAVEVRCFLRARSIRIWRMA